MKNWHHLFVKGAQEEDITQTSHSLYHGELFCICETSGGTSVEELENSLKQVGDDFWVGIKDFIHMHRPSSLAALQFKNNQVFVYCHNATVLLKRADSLFKIAQGTKEAVGETQVADVFFALTSSFNINGVALTKELTQEVLNALAKDCSGGALIINRSPGHESPAPIESVFARPRHKEEVANEEEKKESSLGFNIEQNPTGASRHQKLAPLLSFFSKHKKIVIRTVFAVIFLTIVMWGFMFVFAFVENKKQEGLQKHLATLAPEIRKLENEPFKDPSTTISRLNELQEETNSLREDFPKNTREINTLVARIASIKKEVGNGKITNHVVFFDLDLIDNEIEGDVMDVGTELITVLDKTNKKAHTITIANKSHDTYNLSKISSPTLIAGTTDALFVLDPTKGIYRVDANQTKLIIPADKEWRDIIDIKTFNSNVYLLDRGSDEIYKYTPIEGGYSNKLSYLRSGTDLSDAQNISIDFSLFVLTAKSLYKYTGGVPDEFSVKDQNLIKEASGVYKTSGLDDIYVLDSAHGRIIVLNENGATKKTYYNPLLKDVSSFGVHPEKGVLFLEKNKIYLLDKTEQ